VRFGVEAIEVFTQKARVMVPHLLPHTGRQIFGPIDAGRAVIAFPVTANNRTVAMPSLAEGARQGGRAVHVLVISDDVTVQNAVAHYLTQYGMRVARASSRQEAKRQIMKEFLDLIMLDLQLEGGGLALLREIRSHSAVPVIVTDSDEGDEADRVIGLELGADDYVTKPFGLREILARIRAILRRQANVRTDSEAASNHGHYRFGEWQLDLRTRRLTGSNGQPVSLTKGEYALLVALLGAPGRPLSRAYLLQATRVHEDVFDRSVDVQILRLRRKLALNRGSQSIIRTERGVGYFLDLRVELIDRPFQS
jgi:two-component system, OmpR family, response regulator